MHIPNLQFITGAGEYTAYLHSKKENTNVIYIVFMAEMLVFLDLP